MRNRLGSLHIGRTQVGGVLDWNCEVILVDSKKDSDTYYKLVKWKVTAQAYWLYEAPTQVVIRLYSDGKGYWQGKGMITSGYQKVFNTLIHEPLEIVGEGELEGCEMSK